MQIAKIFSPNKKSGNPTLGVKIFITLSNREPLKMTDSAGSGRRNLDGHTYLATSSILNVVSMTLLSNVNCISGNFFILWFRLLSSVGYKFYFIDIRSVLYDIYRNKDNNKFVEVIVVIISVLDGKFNVLYKGKSY